MRKRDFDKLLLEAVDEGLSSLRGSPKQAIYFHLEKRFNIKKQKIPSETEAFADGIEKIFGLRANLFEILIIKRLYEKIGGVFKWDESTDFTFAKYVAVAKRSFLEKKRSEKILGELVQREEMVLEG